MESTSKKGRRRIRRRRGNPLSDCTNKILISHYKQSDKPSSAAHIFKTPAAKTTAETIVNSSAGSTNDTAVFPPQLLSCSSPPPPPPPHTAPPKTSSITGSGSREVYSRRRRADKGKGKAIDDLPLNFSPPFETLFPKDRMKESDVSSKSKSWTVPHRKKRRRNPTKEDVAEHSLPQDFIEQQRAYFAEIDAFELPEEEVASIVELE